MHIVICDDDPAARETYRKKIQHIAEKNQIPAEVDTFDSGERLLFALSDDPNQMDLIYMDLSFQDKMDGMEAAGQLREIGYENELIFLTSDQSRALESFQVEPLCYIVKHVTEQDTFETSLLRAVEKYKDRQCDRIALSCAGDHRTIPLDHILYFESVHRVIEVHYDDDVFEFYSTLGKLDQLLLDRGFLRVHRLYLINTSHLASVRSGELTLDNGDTVPVGRRYLKSLKQFQNHAGQDTAVRRQGMQ